MPHALCALALLSLSILLFAPSALACGALGWDSPPTTATTIAPARVSLSELEDYLADALLRDGYAYVRVSAEGTDGSMGEAAADGAIVFDDPGLLAALSPVGQPLYGDPWKVMTIDFQKARARPQAAQSHDGLEFHHEVAYTGQPPRHLALHCRANAGKAREGGNLLLCDGKGALDGLAPRVIDALRSTPFTNTIDPDHAPMPLLRPVEIRPGGSHITAWPNAAEAGGAGGAGEAGEAGEEGKAEEGKAEEGTGEDSAALFQDEATVEERFIFSAIGGSCGPQSTYFAPAPGHEAKGNLVLSSIIPKLLACPHARRIEWRAGDLVVVDNHRIMHARLALNVEAKDEDRNIAHVRLK